MCIKIWRKNVPKFIFSGLILESMDWSMAWVTACLVSWCFCTREGHLGLSQLLSDWTDAQKVRLGLLAINSKSPLELNSTLCERGRAFIKEVRCALKLKHNGFAYSLLKLGFKNLLLKIKGEKQIIAVMFCFHSWQSAFLETFILVRNPLPSECMCLFLLSEVFLDVWEYHTITL